MFQGLDPFPQNNMPPLHGYPEISHFHEELPLSTGDLGEVPCFSTGIIIIIIQDLYRINILHSALKYRETITITMLGEPEQPSSVYIPLLVWA